MPHSKTMKTCLVVIDGWGLSSSNPTTTTTTTTTIPQQSDAILAANTPVMTSFMKEYPNISVAAHGLSVGLPDGLMGNSEVGHLNLGAGRVVYQDIVRIDLALKEGTFENDSPVLSSIFNYCRTGNKRIHFIGLVSDGGVHSHISHLKSLLQITKRQFSNDNNNETDIEVYIHAITDGRDTAPMSAKTFLCDDLQSFLSEEGNFAKIGSVCGRYFAMDRDNREERTNLAFEAITKGNCELINETLLEQTIREKYARGETDEFFKPILLDENSVIKSEDCVVFFNFRSDRMRQICEKFIEIGITRNICTMTQYNKNFPFPVLSPPQQMTNVMAEWLAVQGLKQCHVAETEKYAHVTFFFNGGKEEPFQGEERCLIASPKVSTYDLQPEMSVKQVAKTMVEAIHSNKFDFVMGNLAPPDMVGHTGKFDETIKAVEATDEAVGLIYEACKESNVTLFITSDHGNADKMCTEDGMPHTAHTCAPVPFICSDKSVFLDSSNNPALGNIAPTILEYMNISIPTEMTSKSLLIKK